MKLYTNPATPFGRKCQVIAHELGLKLEIIKTLPMQEPEFRRINPLGKIPALVLDDGSVLFDSPVICEYLNHRGGGNFFPGTSLFRQDTGHGKALGLQALGDGILEQIMVDKREAEKSRQAAESMGEVRLVASFVFILCWFRVDHSFARG